MAEVQWKHYLGRGSEVEDILARAGKARKDVLNARRSLMEEYEANGVLPGDRHRYTIAGLLYYKKPPFEFMEYTLADKKTADGREYYIARPSRRHVKGRELIEKLKAPEVTLSPENEIVNMLGVSCMAQVKDDSPQGGTQLVWSSAEQVENIVLVRMPANAPRQRILGNSPKLPPYLKLIKKEVYDTLRSGDLSILN